MRINYKKELEEAAKNMILVHKPHTLIRIILRTLVRKVRVAHAGILLYERSRNSYIVTVTRGELGTKIPAGHSCCERCCTGGEVINENISLGYNWSARIRSILFSLLEKAPRREIGQRPNSQKRWKKARLATPLCLHWHPSWRCGHGWGGFSGGT